MTLLSTTLRPATRGLHLLLFTCALALPGMSQSPPQNAHGPDNILDAPVHTFYLTNVTNGNDPNEITTLLRNMLNGQDRIYFLPSKNAIVLRANADDITLAQHLITELDRPRKVYKLTYTLTEIDNGKRIGVQHFDVVVLSGQKVILKQGNKVPIVTGGDNGKNASVQFTYLDVGINIDAEIIQGGDRVTLKTKVERSSISEEPSGSGPQDPIIRQAVVEGEVNLQDGKPLIIGSMDVVGSTRHIDIDVVAQTLP